jgi:hypothetical protein
VDPPQKVVVQLFGTGFLEGVNGATLWIQTVHDGTDRAIFARRVHALQHEQHRTPVFGVQAVSQVGQQIGILANFLPRRFLVEIARDIARVEIALVDLCPCRDRERLTHDGTPSNGTV